VGALEKEVFVCFDVETTGLDPEKDRIIEIACVRFSFEQIFETYETLVDPGCSISLESMEIHHITDEMVLGKPKIEEILPFVLKFIGKSPIVGHGIGLDISFICAAAKRFSIPCQLESQTSIDTLRMARLYGESPYNSLERLRQHFNIEAEGAHRAMNDVVVNIDVFKFLSKQFKTSEQLLERLKRPILLKTMPLGKHKGRPFSEIPIEYLQWVSHKNFDQDLLFSARSEIKQRKKGQKFIHAGNPFADL
jgi:DNA polymerase-3 subunit epsilon